VAQSAKLKAAASAADPERVRRLRSLRAVGSVLIVSLLAVSLAAARPTPPPPGAAARGHGRWIGGFAVTEYWPVPESWFVGKLVSVPGLSGRHRVDWLLSAEGVAMQGEGMGLDGRVYHIESFGDTGWVTAEGKPTVAAQGFTAGPPAWLAAGLWRNRSGQVTFPLQAGGWSDGPAVRYVPLKGVSFAPGASLPLTPYGSLSVDPSVIPLGSLVYLPAYRSDVYHGWFVAQDTGGAIKGRRLDVYRTPPASAGDGGLSLAGEAAYVISPGQIRAGAPAN
jgi:hypothetical protein